MRRKDRREIERERVKGRADFTTPQHPQLQRAELAGAENEQKKYPKYYHFMIMRLKKIQPVDPKRLCTTVMPNTHRRRRRDETVLSRQRRRCEHEFATSSRRLPTYSVDNLETGQTDYIAV